MEPAAGPRDILLVEDSLTDAELLQRCAFEYMQVPPRFSIVHDGDTALAFLRQQGFYAGAPRPHVIILDIGLPKRSGWDILADLRATPSLTTIPVIMLTGVLVEEDTAHLARLQPTLCLLKPLDLEGYRQLVQRIEEIMNQDTAGGQAGGGEARAREPALTAGVETFMHHLKERAQDRDIPIEATLWQHYAAADLVELTVVSRRKSYIFSVPASDLTDPHYAALYTEVTELLLTAIKENIPMVGVRVPPSATERDHITPVSGETGSRAPTPQPGDGVIQSGARRRRTRHQENPAKVRR